MEKVILLVVLFSAMGCVHATIVPFSKVTGEPAKAYPTTVPDEVGIYRSTRPFDSFIELGLITYVTEILDLPSIYNVLRADSARQGAQAVIDVKIKGETHTETETKQVCHPETNCMPRTDCSADGNCTTTNDCDTKDTCEDETVQKEVSTYTIEGTMIRRKM